MEISMQDRKFLPCIFQNTDAGKSGDAGKRCGTKPGKQKMA